MMKTILTTLVAAVLFTGLAMAQGDKEHGAGPKKQTQQTTPVVKGKAQTTCPVMGGKINKSFYVDYNGKRIYVCCRG